MVPKKKRGRPSNASVSERESQVVSKKKRGRPSTSKAEAPAETQAEEQLPAKKKRGRPSISRPEEKAAAKSPEEAESPKPRKRGRPSKTQQELEATRQSVSESQSRPEKPGRILEAGSETGKRRSRRSDASDTATGVQGTALSAEISQKVRKSRKDKGNASEDDSSRANAIRRENPNQKRKEADTSVVEKAIPKDHEQQTERRRSQKSTQESQETSQTEKPLTYQHLAEVTHRVSRQVIEAKWEPLPPSCIERVSNLLEDIQRPVVVRLGDERKRTQASTALQMVSRRLVSKISKGLPFPQSTGARREDDFDFEKILDRSRDLDAQLTLALHANDLLESELGKENAHLEAEEDALSQLETNAKIEASRRKEAGRKLHTLLQSEDSVRAEEGLEDEAGLGADTHDAQLSLVSLVATLLYSHRHG